MSTCNDDVNDVPLNPAALLRCGLMPGRIRTRQSGLNGETVGDQSQGVQLATVRKLASYWAADYDWRKLGAKLNADCAGSVHSAISRSFCSLRPEAGRNVPPAPTAERHALFQVRT